MRTRAADIRFEGQSDRRVGVGKSLGLLFPSTGLPGFLAKSSVLKNKKPTEAPDVVTLGGRHADDRSRGADGFQGTIRSARNSRMSRTNISSLSITSWKPKRRDLVTSDITSQSQLKT
jgi:hypothetical protein